MENHTFHIDQSRSGERLDRCLAAFLQESGISREKIKRAIKEGQVRVNGVPAASPKAQVYAGDVLEIGLAVPPSALEPEHEHLDILYRDSELAVLNKPAGLTVHPAPGNESGTLAHRLVAHFPELAEMEGFRPGIVHRIDKDTSGLLLVALNEKTRLALSALFAAHEVYKEYLALVRGVPGKGEGIIEAPIGRHPSNRVKMAVVKGGREAKSAWRILHADPEGRFSLLAVRIFSGRTHQIRVHMAHMGHPLLGDLAYGGPALPANTGNGVPATAPRSRQMLHAWRLAFTHPFPPPALKHMPLLHFTCPPPEDFMNTINTLGYRMLRIVITGSPGCGKSSLLHALHRQGVPIFSSDAEVKALYEIGGAGRDMLRARFGDRFVPDDKSPVDKIALGRAMQESDALRREVEHLLHPMVRHAMEAFWKNQETAKQPVAVAEVPLYLEAGFAEEHTRKTVPAGSGPASPPAGRTAAVPLGKGAAANSLAGNTAPKDDAPPDQGLAILLNQNPARPVLIGVHCPFAQRRERLLSKRGWTDAVISSMESWQWPEDSKMAACDIVVPNTGTEEDLVARTEELLARLRALRGLRAALLEEAVRKCSRQPFDGVTD